MNEVDEILAAQGELTSNDDSHPLVRDYLHKRRRALEQQGIFAEGPVVCAYKGCGVPVTAQGQLCPDCFADHYSLQKKESQ